MAKEITVKVEIKILSDKRCSLSCPYLMADGSFTCDLYFVPLAWDDEHVERCQECMSAGK